MNHVFQHELQTGISLQLRDGDVRSRHAGIEKRNPHRGDEAQDDQGQDDFQQREAAKRPATVHGMNPVYGVTETVTALVSVSRTVWTVVAGVDEPPMAVMAAVTGWPRQSK